MPFAPTIAPDADLRTVRGHLAEAATYALELRSRPADRRGEGYTEDVRSAVDFIHEFSAIEDALTRAARPIDEAPESRGGRGQRVTNDGPDLRSLGQRVVEAEGFADWQAAGGRDARGPFSTEVRTLIGGFTSGAYDTNSDAWLPVNTRALNLPSLQRRRPFLRDLIGVQPTGLGSFAYMTESAATTYETGAATTAEGSAKAEVVMIFTPADAPARKITAWIPVTDEMLKDAPTLRGYIDARAQLARLAGADQHDFGSWLGPVHRHPPRQYRREIRRGFQGRRGRRVSGPVGRRSDHHAWPGWQRHHRRRLCRGLWRRTLRHLYRC